MMSDGKKWHYFPAESLPRLLLEITWPLLYELSTAVHLQQKPRENACKNHDTCHMVVTEEGKNILKYNQDKKIFKYSLHYLHQHRITT